MIQQQELEEIVTDFAPIVDKLNLSLAPLGAEVFLLVLPKPEEDDIKPRRYAIRIDPIQAEE